MLSNEQTTQTTRSYPMGVLADSLRDIIEQMKQQDERLEKNLQGVLKSADKLSKIASEMSATAQELTEEE